MLIANYRDNISLIEVAHLGQRISSKVFSTRSNFIVQGIRDYCIKFAGVNRYTLYRGLAAVYINLEVSN